MGGSLTRTQDLGCVTLAKTKARAMDEKQEQGEKVAFD